MFDHRLYSSFLRYKRTFRACLKMPNCHTSTSSIQGILLNVIYGRVFRKHTEITTRWLIYAGIKP